MPRTCFLGLFRITKQVAYCPNMQWTKQVRADCPKCLQKNAWLKQAAQQQQKQQQRPRQSRGTRAQSSRQGGESRSRDSYIDPELAGAATAAMPAGEFNEFLRPPPAATSGGRGRQGSRDSYIDPALARAAMGVMSAGDFNEFHPQPRIQAIPMQTLSRRPVKAKARPSLQERGIPWRGPKLSIQIPDLSQSTVRSYL